jgi:hypothetical protein
MNRPKTMGLEKVALAALAGGVLLAGCSVVPVNSLLPSEDPNGAMKEIMERQDRIIHLSNEKTAAGKPVVLLLHGATDDPTEMTDIVRECRGSYDVFLYCYNFHHRVERVGADLASEIRRLCAENARFTNATVIVYSYSATVFRETVVDASDRSLFSGMSLIQLTPTAGGSRRARWMVIPLLGDLAGLASRPSAAENPYGAIAEKLWGGEGNEKFTETIRPERTCSFVLESDSHSLARAGNKNIRQHYQNGIGTNVIVIPKSAGATHDYFPTNSVGLAYLMKTLQWTSGNPMAATPLAGPAGGRGRLAY